MRLRLDDGLWYSLAPVAGIAALYHGDFWLGLTLFAAVIFTFFADLFCGRYS